MTRHATSGGSSIAIGVVVSRPRPSDGRPDSVDNGSAQTPSSQVQQQPGVTFGEESRPVFMDTFFDSFELKAVPRYNFYVHDELVNDSPAAEGELISDIPRYVSLGWRPAPAFVGLPPTDPPQFLPPRQIDEAVDTLGNSQLSLGVAMVKLSSSPARAEQTPIVNEELVLLSPRLAGVSVNDVVSNASFLLAKREVVFDSLGTAAVASHGTDMIADVSTDTSKRADTDVDVALVGSAALGMIASAPVPGDSREFVEGMMSVAAFSTEIALLDAVDSLVDGFSVSPPSQDIPSTPPTFEYIGYIIERQRLVEGIFVDAGRFTIPTVHTAGMVDTGVLYGGVYRYRICTVVRWVHAQDDSLTMTALPEERPRSTQQGSVVHYLRSSWSPYATAAVVDLDLPAPPEQLIVRPVSRAGEVHVSWRYPDDSQRDIIGFSVYRRTESDGLPVDGWSVISSGLPARNGLLIDRPPALRDDSERYVYAMSSQSIHGQTSLLSEQISCRLTGRSREDDVRQVSIPGVPLGSHGSMITIPPRADRRELISAGPLTIFPRVGASSFMNQNLSAVVRVQSLDTGESRDMALSVEYRNFNLGARPRLQRAAVPGVADVVWVPSQ